MILRKIKQLLGMGSADSDDGGAEQEVVMQDDATSPDTETEAAVKGVDDETESDETGGEGDVDEPVAAETEAAASTESLVDEEGASEDPETRAEPAETTGAAEGEGEKEETTEEPDSPDVDTGYADAEDGTPVDEIKGIGPAYSERLDEVGVHNVAQLAAADPAELAERITVSEKTVGKWVDRAGDHKD
jgi:predicted flap endonuclease-1-like 5' DNA nuclease